MVRKGLVLPFAGLFLFSCVDSQPVRVSPPVQVKSVKEVKEIDISPFQVEYSFKSVPESLGKEEVYPFKGSLKEFCKTYSLNCLGAPETQVSILKKTSLKEALKEIELQSDYYYDYLGGRTLRFSPYQTIVVRFPLISSSLLSLSYLGDDQDSKTVARTVGKNSFFSSLEKALKNFKVEVEEEIVKESKEEGNWYKKNSKVSKFSKEKELSKGRKQENERKRSSSASNQNYYSSFSKSKKGSNDKNGLKSLEKKRRGKKILPVIDYLKENKKENSLKKGEETTQGSSSLANFKVSKSRKVKETNSLSDLRQKEREGKEESNFLVSQNRKENWKFSFQIIKDAGIVSFVVSPSLEREVERILKSVAEQYFSSLVKVKVAVVVVSSKKEKNLETSLSFLKRAYRKELSLDTGNFAFNFTSLSTNYLQGIATGISFNSLLKYVVSSSNGKVIDSISLITLPRTVARIKDYTGIPYLQPQQVSVGGTNPQLSYSVLYVKNGIEMKLIPSVMGKAVYLSISVSQNQYVGDKQVQAGTLGTFSIPIKSPKVINTSLFLKSGQVLIMGGLSYNSLYDLKGVNLFMPQRVHNQEEKKVYFIIQPTLIKLKWRS